MPLNHPTRKFSTAIRAIAQPLCSGPKIITGTIMNIIESAAEFRGHGSFVVGAPEMMLKERYGEIRPTVEHWIETGCRVLLIAQHAGELESYLEPGKLRPLALILLTNRIRPEAKDTFAYFRAQGVAIKVISGDNPMTVSEVARRAGIDGASAGWIPPNWRRKRTSKKRQPPTPSSAG